MRSITACVLCCMLAFGWVTPVLADSAVPKVESEQEMSAGWLLWVQSVFQSLVGEIPDPGDDQESAGPTADPDAGGEGDDGPGLDPNG